MTPDSDDADGQVSCRRCGRAERWQDMWELILCDP
jgi:hypothetical protein